MPNQGAPPSLSRPTLKARLKAQGAAVGRLDVRASPPPGSTSEGVVYGHVSRVIDFQARPQFFLHYTSLPISTGAPGVHAGVTWPGVQSSELFRRDTRAGARTSRLFFYTDTVRWYAAASRVGRGDIVSPLHPARHTRYRRRLLWRERPSAVLNIQSLNELTYENRIQ